MIINERYPDHEKTLDKAGLNMNIFPNLKELWEIQINRNKTYKKNVK